MYSLCFVLFGAIHHTHSAFSIQQALIYKPVWKFLYLYNQYMYMYMYTCKHVNYIWKTSHQYMCINMYIC